MKAKEMTTIEEKLTFIIHQMNVILQQTRRDRQTDIQIVIKSVSRMEIDLNLIPTSNASFKKIVLLYFNLLKTS